MEQWKLATVITLVVLLSVLLTGLAVTSYYNALRTSTPAYNAYNSGTYGNYPSNGNPQYSNQYPYPYTPTNPTQPQQPTAPFYPQQPTYPYYGYPYGSYGGMMGGWGMMG